MSGSFAGPEGACVTSAGSPGPRARSWAPVRNGFLPHEPLKGCLRSAFLGTGPHTQPTWQIILDTKPFPVFTGLRALNTPPDSVSLPFPHLRVGVLTLPRRTSMRVAWSRVDCGTSVLRKRGVSHLLALPGSPVLCSTWSPGDPRRGAPDGRTWQSRDSWGCRAEMCSGEDTWGGSARAGLPSLEWHLCGDPRNQGSSL